MSEERQPVTRERVCAAAIEIIDRQGLAAVTMEALGDQLEVTAMAIYRHFPSKRVLLGAVLERLFSELPPAPEEGSWQARLTALYLDLWRLFRAHPNALPLLAAQPLTGTGVHAAVARAERALAEAGLANGAASRVVTALAAYALGFAVLVAGGYQRAGGAEGEGEAEPEPLVIDWPAAERDFLAGLETMLAGIEARLV